jgi:hypothetical protein
MAEHGPGVLGNNDYDSVFLAFDVWKKSGDAAEDQFRASVARGADIFMFRQFWLRDATHINSIGLGNPLKRTCATCHNHQMTGQDLSSGWVDLGTTNYPRWTEPPVYSESQELPVFKLTCKASAAPHPYLGRVIYSSDPGRALISGRCVDIGSILHEVLVEGTVVPGARICGGIPLKPVHLSVLPEINRACDTILPAEPGIEAPPTRRPAGPSTRQGPVTVAPPAPEKFSPPFSARAWRILYDFDSDFLFLRDTRTVTQAAEFAIAAKAKSIEITAQRAAVLLSNGRTLTERAMIFRCCSARVMWSRCFRWWTGPIAMCTDI